MKLTPAQIRNLASYMGATVKYWLPDWTKVRVEPLELHNLSTIVENSHDDDDSMEYRLQLRPIQKMTKQEIIRFYLIERDSANLDVGDKELELYKVTQHESGFIVEDIFLEQDGLIGNIVSVVAQTSSIAHTGALFAYLQEIGVYLPGFIEEQFVELLD